MREAFGGGSTRRFVCWWGFLTCPRLVVVSGVDQFLWMGRLPMCLAWCCSLTWAGSGCRTSIQGTSYNFIFYFPDLIWKEEGLWFVWKGEMEFFWSCKSGEVFGFWFHKNAFSWSMGISHFLQINFIWKYAQTYRRVISTMWRILSPELFEGLPIWCSITFR